MKVIDSSTLVKYFAKEEGWREAGRSLAEGTVTVDLALKEVANALLKKYRRGEIAREVVVEVVRDLLRAGAVVMVRQEEVLEEALLMAMRHGITVYDTLFIALAKARSLDLVTSDVKQAEAAEKAGVRVVLV